METRKEMRCSFCGKPQKVAKKLISNPNGEAFICDECVDICKEIAEYVAKEHGNYKIIEDRGEAIKEAILDNPNSVVLITGKGNETRQKIGKKFMPCLTDTQYALEALEEYNKKIG